jgi:hypothetical protein
MPVRGVLIAVLAAVIVCAFTGVAMDAAGIDPPVVIIGSLLLGLAALFLVALLVDIYTRH